MAESSSRVYSVDMTSDENNMFEIYPNSASDLLSGKDADDIVKKADFFCLKVPEQKKDGQEGNLDVSTPGGESFLVNMDNKGSGDLVDILEKRAGKKGLIIVRG